MQCITFYIARVHYIPPSLFLTNLTVNFLTELPAAAIVRFVGIGKSGQQLEGFHSEHAALVESIDLNVNYSRAT